MRAWLWALLLLTLPAAGWAQETEDPAGEKEGEAPAPAAAEEPKEPPAWQLPERDAKRFDDALGDYLQPKKDRAEGVKKLEKLLEKDVDGHSALEDVAGIMAMAHAHRVFDRKLKKGRVQEVEVPPQAHGFPGGIGTVKYWLWLPKEYTDRQFWPLLFLLPDNKAVADHKKYLEDWIDARTAIAEKHAIAVPQPHQKGDAWTSSNSFPRAMIALRHAMGTYEADNKSAGPAIDMLRLFVEGEDEAAVVAARFPELFAGAILRNTDGQAPGQPNIRQAGKLSGLPAYVLYDTGKKRQKEFAEALKADNAVCEVVGAEGAALAGDAAAIAAWMGKVAARNAQPREIEYTIHDSSFQRHQWITVLDFDAALKPPAAFIGVTDRARNTVRIELRGVSRFELFLNDALVDLSRPLSIVVVEDDKELPFFWRTKDGRDTPIRDLGTMLEELLGSNHPWRIYPVKYVVDVGDLRRHAAEKEAAAAKEAPPAGAEKAGTKGAAGEASGSTEQSASK